MGRNPKSANERLRSLVDECGISRKGLARRVVDLGAARGLQGLHYDHSSVARWMAGEQPRDPVPELIADVVAGLLQRRVSVTDLGMASATVAADAGLELAATWPDCVEAAVLLWRADVERRRFLKDSALAVSASSVVALQWLVTPRPQPPSAGGAMRVGDSDVAAIREMARTYRDLDNRLGGAKVRSSAVHCLNTQVAPLLAEGSYASDVGSRLAGAAAELAQLAGWMAYDAALHGHAQRYLGLALSFARHAGDDGLGAEILAAQAHQAVYLGRPGEAVDLARAAQVTARRAGLPTLLAECYVMEAHGHAARNDARACARALSEADASFGKPAREDAPGWLRYFDEAYLAARMAHCFRDLGEPGHAERYARRSLDMDGRFVRGKAFNLSLLATALADQDDIEEACAVGSKAVDLAGGLGSARSVRYVRNLQRSLRRRADAPAVREFSERVAERLPAASGRAVPR